MLAGLIELQRLKRLERTGWALRGLPSGTESVAAHSFGVSITAMLLADELCRQNVELNLSKVLRMALIHDWAEARVGDLPRTATAYFGVPERKRAETFAFADIVSRFANGDSYRELYEDYEQRLSLEARLVKAADIIDLLVQVLALERSGARGLDEFWDVTGEYNFELEGAPEKLVREIINSLLNERKAVYRS